MNIRTTTEIKGIIKKSYSDMGWGLCIGAGTSFPVFPSWDNLVKKLLKSNKKLLNSSFQERFSSDTLIQAIQNTLNLSDADFAQLLTEELYIDLKAGLSEKEWEAVKLIFRSNSPYLEKDFIWKTFIHIREKVFKETSAYVIGNFVSQAIKENLPPDVILSFNAEPLLFSLINSFEREKYLGKTKKTGEMSFFLDRVTHSISPQKKSRIKFIFCHGLLLSAFGGKASILTTSDKLVFSESAYLNLVSSSFSWQATEFTHYCLTSTIIFIGVSLIDPNMRRWLSWIQKLKEVEVIEKNILKKNAVKNLFSHYWITKRSTNKDENDLKQACVKHLGIKIIWLNDWKELSSILEMMIN